METLLQGVREGGVTFAHVFPPSAVRWMRPSSVPAQITSALLWPGASVYTTPRRFIVARSFVRKTPMDSGTAGLSRDRSGLMTSQRRPPSAVRKTTFPA